MKVLKALAKLVWDDPWLFVGLLAAVAVAFLTALRGARLVAALVLTLGVPAALTLSLARVGRAASPKSQEESVPGPK